jgi:hypothetical protein
MNGLAFVPALLLMVLGWRMRSRGRLTIRRLAGGTWVAVFLLPILDAAVKGAAISPAIVAGIVVATLASAVIAAWLAFQRHRGQSFPGGHPIRW